MQYVLSSIVFLVVWCVIIYILYKNGRLTIGNKCTTIVTNSFQGGRNRYKITLSSSSGYRRHMIRVKGGKVYQFIFDVALTSGDISVELYDNQKVIMFLDQNKRSGTVAFDKSKSCWLVFQYTLASGQCELEWNLQHTKNI